MEFIDLKAIHEKSGGRIEAAIAKVLSHGKFINGPEVYELEEQLSNFLGGVHCVLCSSGTMALEIALRSLEIGPGDEVITTPFTWISTAETIGLVGAKPVFVDIDPDTYNLLPEAVEAAVTPRTAAIIPVNLFGQMADYAALESIALKHGLPIIEDAAQSLGAEQGGRKSCTVGTVSCTSFFPAKPLGCYGDGGAVFTGDADLATTLRAIVNHGGRTRGEHEFLGTNGRCDTLQAAILLAKLPGFLKEIRLREAIGRRYTEGLEACCRTPITGSGNTHVHAQYTIRHGNRDQLAGFLKERGIPSAVYYRNCLHQQPVFQPLGYAEGSFPNAEKAANEVLSLPFHPYLDEPDQDRIIETVIEFENA
ncbi:MAG: DegT/DnrJ/EryC1/StrS family aminotransferase [Oceanipulchritudo sp.]